MPFFSTISQKKGNGNICILCHTFEAIIIWAWFRPVKHLKMTVTTSVLWKMNIHMANKLQEMVVKLSFISMFHFRSDYICLLICEREPSYTHDKIIEPFCTPDAQCYSQSSLLLTLYFRSIVASQYSRDKTISSMLCTMVGFHQKVLYSTESLDFCK